LKKKSLLKKLFEKAPPAFTKEEKAPQNSHRAKGQKEQIYKFFEENGPV